ncbi:RNA-binding domain-containing protein [Lepidopterella palustris CBS 459.81]|uniref:RNA-binding domain-containing protein n=1 Tax=Lepidopterella palustris CBS 459.81 TaxID=1314670 RepID=A0A8E2EAC9_9PEZI|nr:RNA-binding domain-containing protein [Lepidopterella palustris CBS 459.81]
MAAVQQSGGNPPNNTVYVRNLAEEIKIDQMVEALREIFCEYGTIVDIVAKKSLKRKGQAFIVYDDPASAAQAIEDVQGFELFDKPMTLEYARTKSDATVKREGNDEEFEAHKRRRLAEKERKQAQEAQEAQKNLKRPAGAAAAATAAAEPAAKAKGPTKPAGGAAVVPAEYLPPNKILFVQNLPDDYDVDALTAIFSRFSGFKEVRLVPGRKGLAFVEYDAEQGAISAKESTSNMPLGDESKPMKVTYQRQ